MKYSGIKLTSTNTFTFHPFFYSFYGLFIIILVILIIAIAVGAIIFVCIRKLQTNSKINRPQLSHTPISNPMPIRNPVAVADTSSGQDNDPFMGVSLHPPPAHYPQLYLTPV